VHGDDLLKFGEVLRVAAGDESQCERGGAPEFRPHLLGGRAHASLVEFFGHEAGDGAVHGASMVRGGAIVKLLSYRNLLRTKLPLCGLIFVYIYGSLRPV
jgi:hypothetical protein